MPYRNLITFFIVTAFISPALLAANKVEYVFTCPSPDKVKIHDDNASGYISKTFNGKKKLPLHAKGIAKIRSGKSVGLNSGIIYNTKAGRHHYIECNYGQQNLHNEVGIAKYFLTWYYVQCKIEETGWSLRCVGSS